MYGLLIVINGKITFAIHKHSRNAQKLCDAFEDILLVYMIKLLNN